MAVKRICAKKDKHANKCLACGSVLAERIKDGTLYTCSRCGKDQIADVYPDRIIMTAADHMELRKPVKKSWKEQRIEELEKQLEETLAQLAEAQKSAHEWKEAAEGLARIIEKHNAEKSC